MNASLAITSLFIFPALMAFAAFSDLFTMKISNRLVIATAVLFFPLALFAGLPPALIGIHLGLGALVLVATFAMFAAGWIGGGDAKLAAAIMIWIGVAPALHFVIYAGLIGGALTLAILVARRIMLPAPLLNVGWVVRLHNAKTGIPYGIALAAAAVLVYPDSALYLRLAG